MKHRNSHFAVGYWSRLCRGGALPEQSDIDPRLLKRLLAVTFILERPSDDEVRYRLAGTALCRRYGGELKGRDYLEPWDSESRIRIKTLLRESFAVRIPLCITSLAASAECGTVELETVLMPMSHRSGPYRRFLGVSEPLGDIAPLAGQPIQFEHLFAADLVLEESGPAARSSPVPLRAGPEGKPHPRAPYLRLISSRDGDNEKGNVCEWLRPESVDG
jgi:hypothetical protein